MEYHISLDTFAGPLDLLLYLVKKEEVDILDIPIARITEQFLEHLQVLQVLDVDFAGEFIVMASTLMEIKSRMMLPREEEVVDPEEDPRKELVRQLIEYRKFRDAAALLEERASKHATRLARQTPEEPAKPDAPPAVRPVELWDLVNAFGRLMRETSDTQPRAITVDETPQHVHQENLLRLVRERGRVCFREVFQGPFDKSRFVGLFLAMLELIKLRQLWVEQPEPFGDIWLSPLSPPPSVVEANDASTN